MNRVDEIRELFAFNRWAHGRIFAAVEQLTPVELEREIPSSFPSVRATLAHLAGAEWVWVSRWEGTSPTEIPAELASSDLSGIRNWLRAVESRQDRILDVLTEASLESGLVYTDFAGNTHNNVLGATLRHVVNHASYHRGQIATMLRQLGRKPPTTDLIVFHRELIRA